MNINNPDNLMKEAIKKLALEWPTPCSLYETKIPRRLPISGMENARDVKDSQAYFDFLSLHIFPVIDDLENDAGVRYWHFLNHENLDLRLSIEGAEQLHAVRQILKKHPIITNSLTKWGEYDNPDLGSKFGCQPLLRLYYAQSRFVRDVVQAVQWVKHQSGMPQSAQIVTALTKTVPIYTSHMLMNIFPFFPGEYEGLMHLLEGECRLRDFFQRAGCLSEVEEELNTIASAIKKLQKKLGCASQ